MNTIGPPVVVGYDASYEADLALLWAIRTAKDLSAPLKVVVAAMQETDLSPAARPLEEQEAGQSADKARDALKSVKNLGTEVVVERGWTLPVLLGAARSARMMVVGSRGHGAFESEWLGSASQHLAGHAACPVAVIRPAHNPRARQILVGIDGSSASVRALRFAAERAALTGESVLAVHAYAFPRVLSDGLAIDPLDIDTTVIDSAERLAAELVAGIAEDFPDVELRSTAVIGRPGRVLSRFSDEATLVVVGSRGRNPFQQLLLGSVSQEVLHRAACSIMVVR